LQAGLLERITWWEVTPDGHMVELAQVAQTSQDYAANSQGSES